MTETPAELSNGAQNHPSPSKLIEFPGVSRSSVPQWRKELSERVREVHEKRAREAALEAAEEPRDKDEAINVAPLLELLPQADAPPLNPLVTAALRRIERAHHAAQGGNRLASRPGGAALAYVTETEYRAEAVPELEIAGVAACSSFEPQQADGVPETEPVQLEKAHNLVVVPPQVAKNDSQETKPKPRRMIVENDPALNYLDSIPTSVRVEVVKYDHASAFARLLGAVVDLMVVALLCAPFAALVQLTNGNWKDWRVAATGAALFFVMSFLYFTISTALTGRTFGMRLFSLRIVDARTGLIPTGKQSAGRALVYLGTILTLGLASLYVLIDRDKQTAQDRLTRTTVITV
ncbi:MAG: RDD family protein [Pyrinomonadaceae bacterium]|nr:RDD family protein [Pyrinomonadaceae bacterium]